jgi:IS4 transposase
MPHQNSVLSGLLKQIPWASFDRLVAEHGGDDAERGVKTKHQLIAMIYAQLSGATGLREIEAGLQSHAALLYHLGGEVVSRSSLGEANARRPAAIFCGLFTALTGELASGLRRKLRGAIRLIDSTSLPLNALSQWASFSAGVFGAKAHIIYDPEADRPTYFALTPANVNDITAAKQMPIEAGATYVFDLGYYDYGWWAKLDDLGCRIVTRFKANTPLAVIEERPLPAGSPVLSDRIGRLPKRLAAARKNPMAGPVREIVVRTETGKLLRIFTNDLASSAEMIAELYKLRWAIELFFRWVKQTLRIRHFFGRSENAVRIQVAVALIVFLLLRLAQQRSGFTDGPLAFARLIRVNLMHRRPIAQLRQPLQHPAPDPRQTAFTFLTPKIRKRKSAAQCQPIAQAA